MDEDKKITDDGNIYKILIVDDEKDVLNALCLTLERAKEFKSEISVANDGKEALVELGRQKFDLILSDYKMPEMNGVELLAKVRGKWPKTVRILITGYSDVSVAKEAINNAAVHSYIEKPLKSEELRRIVYEALKRKAERESEKMVEADTVKEAMNTIMEIQKSLIETPSHGVAPKKTLIEFKSALEFNKFTFELPRLKNVNINDIQIFENKHIITLNIYPETYVTIK